MPGAELTEIVDDHNWKGKLNAKFGPVQHVVRRHRDDQSRDDTAHRVVLSAKGIEQKGKGAANAKVTSWLEPGPSDGVTTVKMEADITLTGAAAQLSRGLLLKMSKKLTQNFADCLQESMAAEQTTREGDAAAAATAGGAATSACFAGGRQAGRRDRARHRGDLVDHRELLPQALRAQAQVVVR